MQDVFALGAGLFLGFSVIVAGLVFFRNSKSISRAGQPSVNTAQTVFLFTSDGILIDTTADTEAVFDLSPMEGSTWHDLYQIMAPRFDLFPEDPPDIAMNLTSGDLSQSELLISRDGPNYRVVLTAKPMGAADQHQYMVQSEKLDRLSSAFDVAPNPIWATEADGQLIWSNDAYDKLISAALPLEDSANIFNLELTDKTAANESRTRIDLADGTTRWFEVTSRKTLDQWMHFATDIDTLIEAELAQRNFVQTLTKTFAHLPIGLAVFDRDRRLVLFNPALVDLTRLPVDFLSSRPNLLSFFDHMRETRMMPEPKNYATWRDQLTEVISAARDDRYCETWSLASGLTYKITGRPHPDGAIAFLLEDISAEISLTRRFRSELELTQSVIDCIDDAVAVFSRLGVLSFSNSAYRKLWQNDPEGTLTEISIVEASEDWQSACESASIWANLLEYVLTMQDRTPWNSQLTLRDGRPLHCWVEPVSAGATMVRFSLNPAPPVMLGETAKESETA